MDTKSKKIENKNEELSVEEFDKIADETKREFIKKFGKYAVTVPAGMLLLMSAGTSKAHAGSDTNPWDGWLNKGGNSGGNSGGIFGGGNSGGIFGGGN